MHKEKKIKLLTLLATKLAWLLILFLGHTGRIRIKNRKYWNSLIRKGEKIIIVCWHGRMLLPIFVHRNLHVQAMVSEHGDGELIAKTVERLGYSTVRGSSSRGGTKAFRQMLRAFKEHPVTTILPDGPRGPRHEFKPGAILLSQISGAYLLPMTFAAKWQISFNSWDGFTMWLPFSKVCMCYGKPFRIPRRASTEQLELYRQQMQQRMNRLVEEADGLFRA